MSNSLALFLGVLGVFGYLMVGAFVAGLLSEKAAPHFSPEAEELVPYGIALFWPIIMAAIIVLVVVGLPARALYEMGEAMKKWK